MPAENVSVEINNVALMFLDEIRLLQKSAVVVIRHEADLHAFLFIRSLKVAVAGDFAGIRLGLFAERKHRACQLILSQRKQKVALIFARIAPPLEQHSRAIGALLESRKMASGDEFS